MIYAILAVIDAILALALIVLLVYVVLSWLIAFDIISRRNQFVNTLWEFTNRVTDPVLRRRRARPTVRSKPCSPARSVCPSVRCG